MTDQAQVNTLLVFVRYPEPGKVKTRIAIELGAQKAAELYSLIAGSIIEGVSGSDMYQTAIYFDPPESEDRIRQWLGRSDLYCEPQSAGTIGERMSDAFDRAFSGGAQKAVLIGTDIPDLTGEIVADAFRLLDHEDAVIGPAEDGGYYLLGLKKPEPLLFKDIRWGSEVVFEQTIDRLKKLNIGYKSLDTLRDVDTARDIGPELLEQLTGGSILRNVK